VHVESILRNASTVLPACEEPAVDGKLAGIISIGDVVKYHLDTQRRANAPLYHHCRIANIDHSPEWKRKAKTFQAQ
jgi:hypothetical protein